MEDADTNTLPEAKPGEHPFAPYVRILGKGKKGSRSLSRAEARDAMTRILRGEVEDVQLGAFLMLLRVKRKLPRNWRVLWKPSARIPGLLMTWWSILTGHPTLANGVTAPGSCFRLSCWPDTVSRSSFMVPRATHPNACT